MILTLDERYKVTTDSSRQNLILEKLEDIKDKSTKEIVRREFVQIGFHGKNLRSALFQYIKEKQMDLEDVNISELITALNELSTHVDKVVKRENIRLESNE